jgi:hypothetical protein
MTKKEMKKQELDLASFYSDLLIAYETNKSVVSEDIPSKPLQEKFSIELIDRQWQNWRYRKSNR